MIHLIVGNTGSGKTTYSNKLKDKIKGIVFSIDKWNKALFLPDKKQDDALEWYLERIDRSELIMQNLILQLETVKIDSILDLGLSKVEHREKIRIFAKENCIECKLHFLDISKEIRMKRVMERNSQKGETFEFEVSEIDFEFMEGWFERPLDSEFKQGVHIKK